MKLRCTSNRVHGGRGGGRGKGRESAVRSDPAHGGFLIYLEDKKAHPTIQIILLCCTRRKKTRHISARKRKKKINREMHRAQEQHASARTRACRIHSSIPHIQRQNIRHARACRSSPSGRCLLPRSCLISHLSAITVSPSEGVTTLSALAALSMPAIATATKVERAMIPRMKSVAEGSRELICGGAGAGVVVQCCSRGLLRVQ